MRLGWIGLAATGTGVLVRVLSQLASGSKMLQADVAILEEPEHLTWFHHGRRYTEKFRHVIGIMHTNYVDYVRRGGAGNAGGPLAARIVEVANRRMCDIHCHKVLTPRLPTPTYRCSYTRTCLPTCWGLICPTLHLILQQNSRVDHTSGFAGERWGPLAARIVGMVNRLMCDIHCHQVNTSSQLHLQSESLHVICVSSTSSPHLRLLQHLSTEHTWERVLAARSVGVAIRCMYVVCCHKADYLEYSADFPCGLLIVKLGLICLLIP